MLHSDYYYYYLFVVILLLYLISKFIVNFKNHSTLHIIKIPSVKVSNMSMFLLSQI